MKMSEGRNIFCFTNDQYCVARNEIVRVINFNGLLL